MNFIRVNVQSGKYIIEQDDLRVGIDSTRECNTSLLSTTTTQSTKSMPEIGMLRSVPLPQCQSSLPNFGRITSFEQFEITFQSALFDDYVFIARKKVKCLRRRESRNYLSYNVLRQAEL